MWGRYLRFLLGLVVPTNSRLCGGISSLALRIWNSLNPTASDTCLTVAGLEDENGSCQQIAACLTRRATMATERSYGAARCITAVVLPLVFRPVPPWTIPFHSIPFPSRSLHHICSHWLLACFFFARNLYQISTHTRNPT